MKKQPRRRFLKVFLALAGAVCAAAQAETVPADFLSPETTAAARLPYTENTDAAAAVMRKAERKEPVTIAVIGGSITEGTVTRGGRDSEAGSRKPYAEHFFGWWRETFPDTEFRFINAGIGATDSYLGVHRVQRDVLAYKPDLVLVEYSVNDENGMPAKVTYDNLARRILQDEAHPALMLLFMAQTNGASAQPAHAAVGKHYGLPAVSYRNAMEQLMSAGTYTAADLSGDEVHPSALGHRIVGELLRNRLDEIYAGRENAAEPEAFDQPPATKEAYRNARIADSAGFTPDETGTFEAKNVFSRFPNGWQSAGGKGGFAFTDTFASLGILWLRQTNGKCGRAEVYVDGIRKAALDGDFTGGWGDYAAAKEVYSSREPAEHRVEIVMQEGDEDKLFTLLSLLMSD